MSYLQLPRKRFVAKVSNDYVLKICHTNATKNIYIVTSITKIICSSKELKKKKEGGRLGKKKEKFQADIQNTNLLSIEYDNSFPHKYFSKKEQIYM